MKKNRRTFEKLISIKENHCLLAGSLLVARNTYRSQESMTTTNMLRDKFKCIFQRFIPNLIQIALVYVVKEGTSIRHVTHVLTHYKLILNSVRHDEHTASCKLFRIAKIMRSRRLAIFKFLFFFFNFTIDTRSIDEILQRSKKKV